MKEKPEIIIIRRNKRGKKDSHGGAWKVAYADFITAMMALFLVLWLVASMSIQAKKSVGEYFRSYSVFKGNEAGGGKGISALGGGEKFMQLSQAEGSDQAEMIKKKKDDIVKKNKEQSKKLVSEIKGVIEHKLGNAQNQVLIFSTNDGVRIELVEKMENPMFELGQTKILSSGKEIIRVISDVIKDVPNSITIEGHTDALKYSKGDYTNWELSGDRANAARRELLVNGIDTSRISKVTSFADVLPLNNNDKYDPNNRRVSILIENLDNPDSVRIEDKYIQPSNVDNNTH